MIFFQFLIVHSKEYWCQMIVIAIIAIFWNIYGGKFILKEHVVVFTKKLPRNTYFAFLGIHLKRKIMCQPETTNFPTWGAKGQALTWVPRILRVLEPRFQNIQEYEHSLVVFYRGCWKSGVWFSQHLVFEHPRLGTWPKRDVKNKNKNGVFVFVLGSSLGIGQLCDLISKRMLALKPKKAQIMPK